MKIELSTCTLRDITDHYRNMPDDATSICGVINNVYYVIKSDGSTTLQHISELNEKEKELIGFND